MSESPAESDKPDPAAEARPEPRPEPPPGPSVRALVRRAGQAALATSLAAGERTGDAAGWPYASLVLTAADHDGGPLLLLSDLADHTRNLQARPEAALLFDGTGGRRDPLTGPRATLLGRIAPLDDSAAARRLTARFVARHPGAALYAGFADFRLYRMAVARAHLVAGFGRIHWLDAAEVLFDDDACGALAEAEADIVAHMNADHGHALAAIAAAQGAPAPASAPASTKNEDEDEDEDGGWTMTGIDPEGFDLRRAAARLRIDFDAPVGDAAAARAALVKATRRARAQIAAGDG